MNTNTNEPIQQSKPILNAIGLHEFLDVKIPPREMLLAPIIPSQGLAMIYAARGIGKTFMSLSIALSVAAGRDMLDGRWKAEKARKVLFVDGEMPANVLQERLAGLVENLDLELLPDYLRIITPDMQDIGITDLVTLAGQDAIEEHLNDVKLLVIDNLSSLCRRGKENEAESWIPIQEWLLKLRKRGISVLLIHHAGKGGGQRGTSKREDLLDTVITLKRPQDYKSSQGARFEIHYEKARGFFGEEAQPFEAWLMNEDSKPYWQIADIKDELVERIKALSKEKLNHRKIAAQIGCSETKVYRMLKKMQKQD